MSLTNNLLSFNYNPVYYNANDYKTRIIGTSDCNAFIPVYAIFAHNLIMFEDLDLKVLEYNAPSTPTNGRYERQYARMDSHLRRGQQPVIYKYKLRGVEHNVYMHKGLLYTSDKILMCLAIDTEYLMNTPIEQISTNLDVTKLTLFVDSTFEDIDTLKNIKKKVDLMYTSELKSLGVDIVYTSRMNNWLFKNNFKEPKFKNVMEMQKHLTEVPLTLIE